MYIRTGKGSVIIQKIKKNLFNVTIWNKSSTIEEIVCKNNNKKKRAQHSHKVMISIFWRERSDQWKY